MDQFMAKVLLEQKRNQLHLESFMRHDNIQKSTSDDINPFDQFEDDIQKGKPASIGETRMWGDKKMRKQANGKWVEVSEHGMTKKEHESKSEYYHGKGTNKVSENISNRGSKGAKLDFNASKFHNESASKLSDKEYTDKEIEGKKIGGKYGVDGLPYKVKGSFYDHKSALAKVKEYFPNAKFVPDASSGYGKGNFEVNGEKVAAWNGSFLSVYRQKSEDGG